MRIERLLAGARFRAILWGLSSFVVALVTGLVLLITGSLTPVGFLTAIVNGTLLSIAWAILAALWEAGQASFEAILMPLDPELEGCMELGSVLIVVIFAGYLGAQVAIETSTQGGAFMWKW